ncbi:MmgE/PrpD family protein [Pigmentiphaga soli]|uniref:MmgE/PrpD family protein n=1 Tax=Pigmentiphaga soli TaxID=1007095 RepID=A0ABP8HFI3_9BURK
MTSKPGTTLSERANRWLSHLRHEDVPDDVRRATRSRILDILGLMLAGSCRPPGQAVHAAALKLGSGNDSRILWYGERTSASLAALANGTMAHSLEFDDTHNQTIVHVSVTLVTAGLAIGEMLDIPGRELVTALAGAAELSSRVGMLAPGRLERVGFHPTAIAGAMGAAFLAARLFGLGAEQARDALGIAGSKAAGLMECWSDGSWAKFIHPGIAAEAGIVAATLAQQGFKGPATIFEGRFGLLASHVQDPSYEVDWDGFSRGLGEHWESRNISFKPYPCGHVIHPFLDALLDLYREGLRADEVDSIVCPIAAFMVPIVCEPAAEKLNPRSDWQGRVSLQFALADALVHGRCNVHNFATPSLADPRVLALARRVSYRIDETAPGREQFKGWVIVRTRDGRTLERIVPNNWGSRENPMTAEDVEDKFRTNAGLVFGPQRIEAAIEAVRRIDSEMRVRALVDSCIR